MTRTRVIRPTITIEGVVSDLRSQDYVETIGGQGFRLTRVNALVHTCTQLDQDFRDELAWELMSFGVTPRKAERAAFVPAHAAITLVGRSDEFRFIAAVPCTFRRFTDTES